MNVVSVRRAGVPRAQAFLWFIYPKCPGNYCADATPTRGVWSQIRSLRAAPRSITPLMRSLPPANPPQHGQSVFCVQRRLCAPTPPPPREGYAGRACKPHTYRHVTVPVDRQRAPDVGARHFQSDRVELRRSTTYAKQERLGLSSHQGPEPLSHRRAVSQVGRAGVGFHFGAQGRAVAQV